MTGQSFRISRQLLEDAMRSTATRAGLRAKAEKVASRVDSLGGREGVQMNAKISDGTRPKGRPFSRVSSEQVSQEWGDRYTERRRIMGRVAEES